MRKISLVAATLLGTAIAKSEGWEISFAPAMRLRKFAPECCIKVSRGNDRLILPLLHSVLGNIDTRLGGIRVDLGLGAASRCNTISPDLGSNFWSPKLSACALAALLALSPDLSRADESGVSFWQQGSDDTGENPLLGGFRSRVLGVGLQIGYIFPVGNMQGYLNFKAYGECDAANRPSGWNTWLTFAISPAAPADATPTRHLVTK